MSNIIITGASSGFGVLTARALARTDNTVYSGRRETTGRNASQVKAVAIFSREDQADLRAFEMDVNDQQSMDGAITTIEAEHGRVDAVTVLRRIPAGVPRKITRR